MNLIAHLRRAYEESGEAERLTTAQLWEMLQSLGSAAGQAAAYATEPGELPYGRNVVFRTDAFEAIVIHLPSGARTAVHDHAQSVGCALVVEGELLNLHCKRTGDGMAIFAGCDLVRQGECFTAPENEVHLMINPHPGGRMVGLHLYSPPLTDVTTFRTAPVAAHVPQRP